MKWFTLVLLGFFFFLETASALYCFKCGTRIADDSVFCSQCGIRQVANPGMKEKSPSPSTTTPPNSSRSTKRFHAKTDIYAYQKRGDEENPLTKNFLYKPRRFKMKEGSLFRVLETVGGSIQLETLDEKPGEKRIKGWVLMSELEKRSDFVAPEPIAKPEKPISKEKEVPLE